MTVGRAAWAWLLAFAVAAVACSLAPDAAPGPAPSRSGAATPSKVAAPAVLHLPVDASAMAPSLMSTDGPLGPDPLREVDDCEACHADVARQWRSSAHALSSFSNPIYRVAVDRFRDSHGNRESRFCAGCHDPALLVDAAMDVAVAPNDPRAHAGVSCRTCHSMVHATLDGNGSYALTGTAIPVPQPGDDASVAAHRKRVANPVLGTTQMCASCHRSFLGPQTGHPAHLAGTDDVGPWLRSAFAGGSVTLDDDIRHADCGDCHMPRESAPDDLAADAAGTVASHRFVGGHTWLAAMTGDGEQLERARAFLQGVVSIDVAAIRTPASGRAFVAPETADLAPGQDVEFDVVLRNLSVAHNFPGGTRDAQATWVQVRVLDASGRLLAETARDDRHELKAYLAGEDGGLLEGRQVEGFRTVVADHTIAPRDAVVVRHGWTVPDALARDALPLRVEARLIHQSRSDTLHRLTCRDAQTASARAFTAAAADNLGVPLDACAPQPATEVSAVTVVLGEPPTTAGAPDWRRPYEHGLGLLHDVQENAADAAGQLNRALDLVGDDEAHRASIHAALAETAIVQGRFDDALQLADLVAKARPDHPAAAMLRARAHAGAWRWEQSAESLQVASRRASGNDRLWAELAQAWNSAGHDARALDAASTGLQLAPRSASLLRTQALAATATEHAGAALAADAYERNRPSDDEPHLRAQCARNDDRCARERRPIHAHRLRSAARRAREPLQATGETPPM